MRYRWEKWSAGRLLELRLCDLDIKLEDTWLSDMTEHVLDELDQHGFRFRPHFWLADEWFSPDGTPGVGVPFFLAHKRLMQLEREQMYEVEGGSRAECLMLLRHEVGHTFDTAYTLGRRKRYRELFGSRAERYPDYYRPRPGSRRFVQYLPGWYAQCHPAEDFAETFAVWLDPRSRWRRRYQGWPALEKLRYIDELMRELQTARPVVRSRARPYAITGLRHTLREHYDKKRAHYNVGYSEAYDRGLRMVFDDQSGRSSAAQLLRRNRRHIRELVAVHTGAYEFTVDQLLKEMIGRCKELGLKVRGRDEDAVSEFALMLAVHTTHQLHRGTGWHAV